MRLPVSIVPSVLCSPFWFTFCLLQTVVQDFPFPSQMARYPEIHARAGRVSGSNGAVRPLGILGLTFGVPEHVRREGVASLAGSVGGAKELGEED